MDFNSKENFSKDASYSFWPNLGCLICFFILFIGIPVPFVFIFTTSANIFWKICSFVFAVMELYLSFHMFMLSGVRVTLLKDGIRINDIMTKNSFFMEWQEVGQVYKMYNIKGNIYLIFCRNSLSRDDVIQIAKDSLEITKIHPVISVDGCICFRADLNFNKIIKFIPETILIQDIGYVWI